MTESKKLIVPEFKEQNVVVPKLENNYTINVTPKENYRKPIISISTYSYGSNGKHWYYLSKLNKK